MINELIKQETELEKRITSDSKFVTGANWGKSRNGHPEGKVIFHIAEVLENVDKYCTDTNREKLRLIAIIHDTFKNLVDVTKPKSGENHHAMIARRFTEKYISDKEILDIIELHDEAYNAYSMGVRRNNWDGAKRRAKSLKTRLGKSLDLYLTFYKCDNETGDKENKDYDWFLKV